MAILGSEDEPSRSRDDATATFSRQAASAVTVVSTAEVAECQCPDFCERDHDLD